MSQQRLIQAVTLLTLQLVLLALAIRAWDLPFYDGSQYLHAAYQWLNGTAPAVDWSPLYVAYLASIMRVIGIENVHTVYWVAVVLIILISNGLAYWYFRVTCNDWRAWLLTAWLMGLDTVLFFLYRDMLGVHLLLLIPTLILALMLHYRVAWGWVLGLLIPLIGLRIEFIIPLAVTSGYILLTERLTWRTAIQQYWQVILGLIVLTLIYSASSGWSGRSVYAFRQTFYFQYVARHPEQATAGGNDVAWYDPLVTQIFGDASTPFAAFIANPLAFLEHIAWNALLIPVRIVELLRVLAPVAVWVWAVPIVILLIGALLHARTIQWHQHRAQVVLWLSLSLMVVVSMLIVAARVRYLYMLVPVVLLIMGVGADYWVKRLKINPNYMLAIVFALLLGGGVLQLTDAPRRDTVNLLNTLREYPHWDDVRGREYSIMGYWERAGVMCFYADFVAPDNTTCTPYHDYDTPNDSPLWQYLVERRPQFVILSREDTLTPQLVNADALRFTDALQQNPNAIGWELYASVGEYDVYALADEPIPIDLSNDFAFYAATEWVFQDVWLTGDFDTALITLPDLIARQPTYPVFRELLAHTLYNTGDFESAGEQYEMALALRPQLQQSHIYAALGDMYWQRGAKLIAADYYREYQAIVALVSYLSPDPIIVQRLAEITPLAQSTCSIDQIGVHHPQDATWSLLLNDGELVFDYGAATQHAFMGDWDGDGVDTVGIYADNTFFLSNQNAGGLAEVAFGLGIVGDVPLVGDWDGDGMDTVGLYRPNSAEWFLFNRNENRNADLNFIYGDVNLIPVTGDWDGDGVDTVGVYRADSGEWLLRNSNTGGIADSVLRVPDEIRGIPITGTWSEHCADGIGFYDNGLWTLYDPLTLSLRTIPYGEAVHMPVVGRWQN